MPVEGWIADKDGVEFISCSNGFKVTQSGVATILEKGEVRFSVYDVSKSTGGPSAAKAIVSTGEETMKVRLKP
ncbi:MAG: hypothetical protein QOH71_560 [Blastocatellia bacterium]|nr:hypothetical protein [Blastocatellia bacterium]